MFHLVFASTALDHCNFPISGDLRSSSHGERLKSMRQKRGDKAGRDDVTESRRRLAAAGWRSFDVTVVEAPAGRLVGHKLYVIVLFVRVEPCKSGRRGNGHLVPWHTVHKHTCSVSQKNPPWGLGQFFQNGWGFFNQILRAYYAFLSTLDCKFFSVICNFDEVMPY